MIFLLNSISFFVYMSNGIMMWYFFNDVMIFYYEKIIHQLESPKSK